MNFLQHTPAKVPVGTIYLGRQQEPVLKLSFIKHENLSYAQFADDICEIFSNKYIKYMLLFSNILMLVVAHCTRN